MTRLEPLVRRPFLPPSRATRRVLAGTVESECGRCGQVRWLLAMGGLCTECAIAFRYQPDPPGREHQPPAVLATWRNGPKAGHQLALDPVDADLNPPPFIEVAEQKWRIRTTDNRAIYWTRRCPVVSDGLGHWWVEWPPAPQGRHW